MKVLVDGDIVVFRAAFAAEKVHYLLRYSQNGRTIERPFDTARALKTFIRETELQEYDIMRERDIEPVSHVYANIDGIMDVICEKTGTAAPLVYLTGTGNFRRNITKEYKANRDPTMRPHFEIDAKAYLFRHYGAYSVPGIEADDAIGLEMGDDAICVSLDKDLDMLPGKHYNWVKDVRYTVTPDAAHTNFYKQMLTGDRVDNVKGVPGIGPARAAKLLEGLPEMAQAAKVRAMYAMNGLDYEMNYHLLKIIQTEDDLHEAFEYIRKRQAA